MTAAADEFIILIDLSLVLTPYRSCFISSALYFDSASRYENNRS